MSFFKKAIASTLGIGGAKIDAVVTTKEIYPGEIVEGIFKIRGGNVSQEISDIELDVNTYARREGDDTEYNQNITIQTVTVPINRKINEGEYIEVPFSFKLHIHTPISMHKSKVWISTQLGIDNALDSRDKDYINVSSPKYVENVLQSVQSLGFRIREVENEYRNRQGNDPNYLQEFEFVAYEGEFRGKLDELEIVFVPRPRHVSIYFELDRRARGLRGLMMEELGLDESKLRVQFDYEELSNVEYIKNQIQNMLRQRV